MNCVLIAGAVFWETQDHNKIKKKLSKLKR